MKLDEITLVALSPVASTAALRILGGYTSQRLATSEPSPVVQAWETFCNGLKGVFEYQTALEEFARSDAFLAIEAAIHRQIRWW